MGQSDKKIEDLAIMVKHGFDHMDEKFNKRFDEVDTRFNDVDKRFDLVEGGLDHLNRKMDGLELKVSSYASSWDKNFDNLHDWVRD